MVALVSGICWYVVHVNGVNQRYKEGWYQNVWLPQTRTICSRLQGGLNASFAVMQTGSAILKQVFKAVYCRV